MKVLANGVYTLFPFLETIKEYSLSKGRADLIAGITVAIVASPQSMAYAMIAGVDPVYGLYASILPVIIAALWGSSKYLTAGPTNALSMVLYASMLQIFIGGIAVSTLPEEQRLTFIFMLAILTGLIQLFIGFAHLGSLANFISHSVILAFTTGASILIGIGQVKNFFGLDFESPSNTFALIMEIGKQIHTFNIYTVGIGLFTIAVAVALKKYVPKAPYALLSLIIASLASTVLSLENYGVAMSPPIPKGFPPLYIPDMQMIESIPTLFMPALALAMLASVETIAIGKTMANKRGDFFNPSQELIGQGLGNIVAGLSSAIPGCGSFSRSAVNFTSGAKTRFAAVISGFLTLLALLVLGPFVRYIPIASLAALLMLICWNMINIQDIRFIIRSSKNDCAVFFITVASVFILDLEQAIFVGVLISLSLFLRKQSISIFHELEREMIPVRSDHPLFDCENFHVYCIEGPIFFGSVSELEKHLKGIDGIEGDTVILHMNRVNMIDASGAHALETFLARMKEAKVSIILCSSNHSVCETITKADFLNHTQTKLVTTMQEAFAIAEQYSPCGEDNSHKILTSYKKEDDIS